MSDTIVNRVAKSNLITVDLEELYPEGDRVLLDISQWLFEGLLLREKDFREQISAYDWKQHADSYVALHCSTDAIIPSWAYLLITTQLSPYAKRIVVGDLALLETLIYHDIIASIDTSTFENKPIIVKGCTDKPIPPTASTMLIEKLQPVAKSIMFGEACSTVPLFKKKN